jgi:c-di-GMP-binding flagellar brake protein YcgR
LFQWEIRRTIRYVRALLMRQNMIEQYSGIEKRKFTRVAVNFLVFYRVNFPLEVRLKIGNRAVEALAADISEGGMAVYTDYDIPPGTIVTVEFIMMNDYAISAQDRSRSIIVGGQVRYNVFFEEKKIFRFGIQFIDLTADGRIFISNFIAASKLR